MVQHSTGPVLTREELLELPLMKDLIKGNDGEIPEWVDTNYYDLMWKWINAVKFKGSFRAWLMNKFNKTKDKDLIARISQTLIELDAD